jgi:hypothetical protein
LKKINPEEAKETENEVSKSPQGQQMLKSRISDTTMDFLASDDNTKKCF